MAAKPKPVKKPAKAAKKPTKPVAKAKPAAKAKAAPARKAQAKPLPKAAKPKAAKPVAKKAPAKAAPAKSKVAAKAKPATAAKAKPPAKKGPVKRLAEKLVKLVTPAKAPPAAAKPAPKAAAKPPAAAASPAKPAATPAKGDTKSARNAMTAAASKETDSTPARAAAPRTEGGARARAVKPTRVITPNEPPPLSVPQRVDLPQGYRPTADEEYMSPAQLEYFRQKLINWRAELVEESKQTIDNLREEVRDVGDDAERATRETENSLELRTRDRYRKLISKIDKALKRIEDGAYGYCEETGEEIGVERLEARPIATLCLDAQERWEHRQKLMGD